MAIAEVMGRRFVQYLKVTILLLITGAVFAGVFPTLALSTHEEDLKPAEVKSADLLDQSWCDQPLAENDPPALKSLSGIATHPLDPYWLAPLEEAGLTPAPPASADILLRRLHYVLTGLPPSPEEVETFLKSDDPLRYEKQVDKLLSSEQFGVHWARHWLDLVRWAETDGYERDRTKPHAWKYRNWVIDAFNSDMPYDRFLTEQLAGDELEDERVSTHIATGFLHLGIRNDESADTLQAVYTDFDSMLDTTCRSMLGISMGCARCHDHKGDPIPTRDYYRMLSFFERLKPYDQNIGNALNTENFTRELPSELGLRDFEAELESWKRSRTESLLEARHLIDEVKARWGTEAFAGAAEPLLEGRVLHLDFNTGDVPEAEIYDTIEFAEGREGSQALHLKGKGHLSIERPVANDFTIAFWFKSSTRGSGAEKDPRWFMGTGLVDGEINGVHNDFGISLIGSRIAAGTGNPETFVAGPKGITDDRWHHVCFTRQQSTGQIRLWIDGIEHLPYDERFSKGGTQPLTASDHLSIGRSPKGGNRFKGSLDELGFWNRVLSPTEILHLFQEGGFLPQYSKVVEERLGVPEAERLRAAESRILSMDKPSTDTEWVLSAQEIDLSRVKKSYVRIRGNASSPDESEELFPGFPEFLGGEKATISPPSDGETSGRRLALARWITSPDNPRTARVLANRLWQHVFGTPIVGTPNDFGVFGLPPSHPELLNAMARELIQNGWSMKYMIRQLVTSSAFRISGEHDQLAAELDPTNKLYWRFPGRRLSAEEIRDSVLAVSGNLNLAIGGTSVFPKLPAEVLSTSSRPGSAWPVGDAVPGAGLEDPNSMRRSVYVFVKRSLPHPLLVSFDLADTDTSCPVRFNTVQPTQALTLLNSEFSDRQARLFAERLNRESEDPRSKVRRALELVTQKQVSETMVDRHFEFLKKLQADHQLEETEALAVFCLATLNLNEFVHLD